MIINHNLSAINAQRQMYKTSTAQAKSTEKLSSGLRINRAGDDAAGLAISEKMRGQISGLNQASRNAQDGISLIQTAEGALDETHSMLQRMRELAVQASNGTYTAEDKQQLQNEIEELQQEITAITEKTEFNTKKLLNGDQKITSASVDALQASLDALLEKGASVQSALKASAQALQTKINNNEGTATSIQSFKDMITSFANSMESYFGTSVASHAISLQAELEEAKAKATNGGVTFQVGANTGQTITIGINSLTAKDLNIHGINVAAGESDEHLAQYTVLTDPMEIQVEAEKGEATDAISLIDKAINKVSTQRSKMGAIQNRLEHTIASVDNAAENLQSAESRIRDTDMAKEMMTLTSKNILSQATQAMLAQANQKPNQVLSLLQ
jgi:flagellin